MCCKKGRYVVTVLVVLIALFAGWRLINTHDATAVNLEQRLSHYNQDPNYYIDPKQPTLNISPAQQAQLAQTFLALYFSPWDNNADSAASTARVLAKTQQDQEFYLQNQVWQYNKLPFSVDQIKKLIANADLTGFPNFDRPAIIVHTTQARVFPTLLPSYWNPELVGQGYPFDNWIESYLFPGTPVRILQRSQDSHWYLLKTSSYNGWTPVEDVALVSPEFITEWKKYSFIVVAQDNAPLYNSNSLVLSALRKGMIYPTSGDQGQQVKILTAAFGADGYAQMVTLLANKADTQTFPIPATAQNIANNGKAFINGQYGWGELYELRDCSSTTEDILSSFGLWLPRNSLQQSRMGKVISLVGMSGKEKLQVFAQQAVPFFTIVHFPGHIALYVGMHDGRAYILQDVWGFHTVDFYGREGRAIIGKTAITPIDFAKGFTNIKTLQLDRADSISILTPESYTNIKAIQENIWK